MASEQAASGDPRGNRQRILTVARRVLSESPQAPIEDIARAAGVVRRTVYGHFPSRDALITQLLDETRTQMKEGIEALIAEAAPPEVALARFTVAVMRAGDQYRLLLALAGARPGNVTLDDVLAPANDYVRSLLGAGQQAGDFRRDVPAEVLGRVLQAATLSLLDSANDSTWPGDPFAAATLVLLAAGVPHQRCDETIARLRARDPERRPAAPPREVRTP